LQGSADAPASAKDDASKAKSFEQEPSDAHSMHSANGFGRGSKETLLIGTSNQTIVQVDPKSGHLMATLTVPTPPTHIAADETNIYFGGSLGRYDLATHEVCCRQRKTGPCAEARLSHAGRQKRAADQRFAIGMTGVLQLRPVAHF
jgi:hypothetical protein